MDLTIKANTYITNANFFILDKCDSPNDVLINNNTMVVNTATTVDFKGAGTLSITNEVLTTNIASPTLNITTGASNITIDGTTWQSILDRLDALEGHTHSVSVTGTSSNGDVTASGGTGAPVL